MKKPVVYANGKTAGPETYAEKKKREHKLLGDNGIVENIEPVIEDNVEDYVEQVNEKVFDKEVIPTVEREEKPSYENSPRVLIHDASIEQIQELLEVNDTLSAMIEDSLSTILIREREIIRMRLGLSGYQVCSVIEVAQKFNVCDARIRQYEAKFLRHFRRYLENKPSIY